MGANERNWASPIYFLYGMPLNIMTFDECNCDECERIKEGVEF